MTTIDLYEDNAGHLFVIDEAGTGYTGFQHLDAGAFAEDAACMAAGDIDAWTMDPVTNEGYSPCLVHAATWEDGVVTVVDEYLGSAARHYLGLSPSGDLFVPTHVVNGTPMAAVEEGIRMVLDADGLPARLVDGQNDDGPEDDETEVGAKALYARHEWTLMDGEWADHRLLDDGSVWTTDDHQNWIEVPCNRVAATAPAGASA